MEVVPGLHWVERIWDTKVYLLFEGLLVEIRGQPPERPAEERLPSAFRIRRLGPDLDPAFSLGLLDGIQGIEPKGRAALRAVDEHGDHAGFGEIGGEEPRSLRLGLDVGEPGHGGDIFFDFLEEKAEPAQPVSEARLIPEAQPGPGLAGWLCRL